MRNPALEILIPTMGKNEVGVAESLNGYGKVAESLVRATVHGQSARRKAIPVVETGKKERMKMLTPVLVMTAFITTSVPWSVTHPIRPEAGKWLPHG